MKPSQPVSIRAEGSCGFTKVSRSLPSRLARGARFVRGARDAHNAQGMLEFALALPVLLLLIFGVIEFARILSAWLSVENGARFGIRYAVTGEYDQTYCSAAGSALGLSADDQADGQVDCRVPAWVEDNENKESQLVDWARLPSIRDTATDMALALSKDPAATQGEPHFFKVTVCSSRDANGNGHPDFVLHEANTSEFLPARCTPSDDPGAPGDRVTVVVDFNHPLILPGLSNIWPQIHLSSRRDGVVERFRTSRVINLPMDIVLPTFTPTVSPTPTTSPTPTVTPTATPVPDCSLYSIGGFSVDGNAEIATSLISTATDNPQITRLSFNWGFAENMANSRNYLNLYADWMAVGGYTVWGNGANDMDSPTDSGVDGIFTWTGPVPLPAGSTQEFRADLDNQWPTFGTDMLGSDFGLTMYLDNGCVISRSPAVRPIVTPTPDCSLLTLTRAQVVDDNFDLRVRNNNAATAYLIDSILVWPTDWGMYFNEMAYAGYLYYTVDSTVSPVRAQPSPPVAHPGFTSQTWRADFNNWPAIARSGYLRGELLFDFPGWGTCRIFGELNYVPPPTATATPLVPNTPVPTNPTVPPTATPTPVESTLPPPVATNTATPTSETPVPPPFTPTVTPTFNLDG